MNKQKKKKVVVIGGGNGSAVCLEGLKKYTDKFDIFAVISMSDSGGSSGRLRKEFGTLPPGDIMRAILALAKYDYQTLKNIFYQPRFANAGKLNSHNLGNLFLVLISKYAGNFLDAIEALSQSVEAQGKVYPVTMASVDLAAELDNGDIVRTEAFIDEPQYNRGWKIKKVWLEPADCGAYSGAVGAIINADCIMLAPGSLYTSLIATLLPRGVKEAIQKNKKAKLIYIAGSAYRLDGETGPEKISDVISNLERYLPRKLDLVLYNNHKLNASQKVFYKEKKWGVIELDLKNIIGAKIVGGDYEKTNGGLDPVKLAKMFKKYYYENKKGKNKSGARN